MKAVGYRVPHALGGHDSLVDIEVPAPVANGRDMLVEIRAISVNPVDTKVRLKASPAPGDTKILGWDAAGVVQAVGSDVTLFKPGDEVWYAGALGRPGSNAQLHLVDERIVGRKPRNLDFADAAALPLTSITAWELLFEQLSVPRTTQRVREPGPDVLLIVGGSGGVGSILTQLARQYTDLTIIATASRPETRTWLMDLGAHHVIDHREPLAAQIASLGFGPVRYVASLNRTDYHLPDIVNLIAPFGHLALIDDPVHLDVVPFKSKSVSIHWEFMFARSSFGTPDMQAQHDLLNQVAEGVESGAIRSTATTHLGTINAANLIQAHALLESGGVQGKIVLAGF